MHTPFHTPPKYRQGFTLTEVAIVLGVMGLIIGSIWVAFGSTNNSNKAQQAIGQIQTIVGNYKKLYGNKPIDVTTATDFTCVGVNAGFFPSNMLPNVACVVDPAALAAPPVPAGEPTYPKTPWGGTTYAQVLLYPPSQGSLFDVRYGNPTKAACIALATDNTAPDILGINVSGNLTYFPPLGTGTPLTAA